MTCLAPSCCTFSILLTKVQVPLRMRIICPVRFDVFAGNGEHPSAGLLVLKSRAYSGSPEISIGNVSRAGRYANVLFDSSSTVNLPSNATEGVIVFVTDPIEITFSPLLGVEAKKTPKRSIIY